MVLEVEGIVLNTRDYGESSKILNVLTKDHGLIGIMAKGCKRLKSDIKGVSEKLGYAKFNIYYKEDKLSTLASADIINNFYNIKKDITKISFASFLLELTEQVVKQNRSDDIYELLINALIKINDNFDPLILTNIVELKYLDYLGVMPIIDGCSVCGSTNSIATLSSSKGGYICNNCLTNEKLVSDKTIKLIRLFYYVDIAKISKLEISNLEKKEINEFLDEYYDSYTGLYLKSKNFLKNLNKII